MVRDIRPLLPHNLGQLSHFLRKGFHAHDEADFAAQDVLQWKYLTSCENSQDEMPKSYIAQDENGVIVGHVGICTTAFNGCAIGRGEVKTFHMIDWLGAVQHRAVGATLMRKVQETAPTQFAIGGSSAGRAVIKRAGYVQRDPILVYQRILRPSHWLSISNLSFSVRSSHLIWDVARKILRPAQPAIQEVQISRVDSFSNEVTSITDEAQKYAILSGRSPSRLNYFLHFPRQLMSGWLLFTGSRRLCGFALLNLVPHHQGRVRVGKIVDCVIGNTDIELWHACIQALTHELGRQRADIVQSFASTPWINQSFQQAGFVSPFTLEFSIRDRHQYLPNSVPFHLMPIEADYAYT
jgi:hypothetical protein